MKKTRERRSQGILGTIVTTFLFKVIVYVALLVISFVFIAGSALAGVLGGSTYAIIKTTPILDAGILKPTGLNSFVHDADGNIIAELKREENRIWINYEDIPEMLVNAYIAVEDKRFLEHKGIDFKRIGSAMISYTKSFFNPSTKIQGGSTITQQLIKNITNNDDVTIKRKIQEQWQALQLEKGLTKNEIITYYLNNVPMGGNFFGIETAAKGYFGKDVRDLTLEECASLAGITNWPTKCMPTNSLNIEANIERTHMILKLMLEQGMITKSEYDEATAGEIKFKYNPDAGKVVETSKQSYFVDEAIKNVKKDLMERYQYSEKSALDTIYNGGIHIYTTLQPQVQSALDEVFTDPQFFIADNPRTGALPEAAMVIIEPTTGYVRGIYGGRGIKEGSVFNRATQAVRSPGSSIKPLVVYAPGIETRKVTAATVVDDIPQYLNEKTPNKIWPNNVERKNFGLTTVRDGFIHSRNVVATLILRDYTGISNGLNYLTKVGIERNNEHYLSVAMGGFAKGMTPLQMASAYAVFANKGVYTHPVFYTEVKDQNGRNLLEAESSRSQVYSEETVFIMDNIMEDIVKKGTAAPYGIVKYKKSYIDDKGNEKKKDIIIPSAGKTGTTDDTKDKWFIGFTPYYVGAVWYGYDISVPLSKAENSSALKIWNAVMTKVHENKQLEAKPFFDYVPPNIVKRTICIDSGQIATELCYKDPRGPRVREEYFIKGTEPAYSETCTVHVEAEACIESKDDLGRSFHATEYCPTDSVVEGVFIRRPVEYKPRFAGEAYPLDIIYELAKDKYCTVHGPPDGFLTDYGRADYAK